MKKDLIKIRPMNLSDAKAFYEIISKGKFKYFPTVKSLAEEKKIIKQILKKKKLKQEYAYSIIYNDNGNSIIVGGIGIKINPHTTFIGEVGYFIDKNYWNKGIATLAVKLIEKEAFLKHGIKRIEIRMNPKNISSEKVAIKAGYIKEAYLKKAAQINSSKLNDVLLYVKFVRGSK
ncbi:MAG: GNAT family N-acetyltransferase [Candidatus Woesearchaeota archaeon]